MSLGIANNPFVNGEVTGESLGPPSRYSLATAAARSDPSLAWQMSPSEQVMIRNLVKHLKPKAAIEIGTRFGGSLQVLAKFCDRVYTLDNDPKVEDRLKGRFDNVDYLMGPSNETLPPLLDRLQRENTEVSFVLVDGDHSTEGVRRDLDNLLRYKPSTLLYIVIHDSFNPGVRRGLRTANWAGNPYVHRVELDFVAGGVATDPRVRHQLWGGGLAIAILSPEPRGGNLEISARSQLSRNAAARAHKPGLIRSFANRIAKWTLRLKVLAASDT